MSGLRVDTLAPRINDTGRDVETQTIVKSGHDIVGFENREDSYLTFDALARTVTITPVDDYYSVYWQGKKHRISEPLTVEFANISGCRYIYLDPVENTLYEGVCRINVRDVLCAYIKYNADTQQLVIEGDERHSADRDLIWHLSHHADVGMMWRSGGVAEYELNTINTAIKINGGLSLADEDLVHIVNQGVGEGLEPYTQDIENGRYEVLHLGGEAVVVSPPSGLPYKFNPLTRRVQYNKVEGNFGRLEDVPDGHYVNAFIVGTNCQRSPVKILMGRIISDESGEMMGEEIAQFGLMMSELVFMYQVLISVDYSLTNDGSCKISAVYKATTSTGKAVSSPAMGVAEHNALFGRYDQDSHDIDAITGLRAAINSKVNIDSPTLTDAREWIAETVGLPEAAEGTSIERRAWTAQAIRHAITSWFAGISGAIGRKILSRGDAAQVRADLELGTSATLNVGNSTGNVMSVGAGGVLTRGIPWNGTGRINGGVNGFYSNNGDGINVPDKFTYGGIIQSGLQYDGYETSIFLSLDGSIIYRYYLGGAQQPDVELLSTSNIQTGTGQSNTYPMSQAAVTNQLATKADTSMPVPNNDLNNATAPGSYHWTTGVANVPVDFGSMVVTAWDGVGGQTAEQLVMKNDSMWIRGKNNSSSAWSAWRQIYHSGNMASSHINVASLVSSGNVTAYSDIKLKEGIEVIPNAITKIKALHGYTYKRKDIEGNARHTGVIAQEVQKVLPEAVTEDEEGTLSVAYGNMVGLLIEAIKELNAEVDRLKVNHKEDT